MLETSLFGAQTIFTAWVIFFGGADRLEDTIESAFLIHFRAPLWTATGIKIYVGASWFGTLVWLWHS